MENDNRPKKQQFDVKWFADFWHQRNSEGQEETDKQYIAWKLNKICLIKIYFLSDLVKTAGK